MGWVVNRRDPPKQVSTNTKVNHKGVTNDKIVQLTSPAQAMCTCGNNVWVSQVEGCLNILNSRTAEPVMRFENNDTSEEKTYFNRRRDPAQGIKKEVLAMVAITSKCSPQVWLGYSHGSIEVRDGISFKLVDVLEKNSKASVTCLAEFGDFVYSAGEDKRITQWHAERRTVVSEFRGRGQHEGTIRCLFAEGNAVVSGSDDCTVKVWNIGSGSMELTGYFHAHCKGVHSLCRVEDCMWSGDGQGHIAVWHFRTCEPVAKWKVHEGTVTSIHRVLGKVYSSSSDGTIAILSSTTGQLLQRIQDQSKGSVNCLGRTGDLCRFVIWSADSQGVVRCWHHDEYSFVTRDQQIFSDPSWYRSGSTPYQEYRNSLGIEIQNAQEHLIDIGRKPDLSDKLQECLSILRTDNPLKTTEYHQQLEDDYRTAEKRRDFLLQAADGDRRQITHVENELRESLGKLQSLQADLNRLVPGLLKHFESTDPAALVQSALQAVVPLPSVVPPLPEPDTSIQNVGSLPPPPPGAAVSLPPPGATGVGGVPPPPPGATGVGGVPPPAPGATGVGGVPPPPPGATGVGGVPPPPPGAAVPLPPPGATGVGGVPPPPAGAAVPTQLPGVTFVENGGGVLSVSNPGNSLEAAIVSIDTLTNLINNLCSLSRAGVPLTAPSVCMGGKASASGVDERTEKPKAVTWDSVSWTNPNIHNYIQRRYYGAAPSLRTPDFIKEEKKRRKVPVVKVIPLRSESSAKS